VDMDALRAYLLAPARDGNPAVEAARRLLADRDQLKAERDKLLRELGRRADLEVRIVAQHQEADELRAGLAAYERELTRLRDENAKLTPAPWEVARGEAE
jgi:cell division protein FtsB